MAGMASIDMELLIESVERRPALYLKSHREYCDANIKNKLWDEVSSEVVKGWAELDGANKILIGAEVKKKWLNLRTCFARELKAQATKPGIKRRKYIYFKKLLFLKSSTSHRPAKNMAELVFRSKPESYQDPPPVNPPTVVQEAIASYQESSVRSVAVQDLDEDKHFVLSLIPTLRSLTEYDKFQAKIEILQLLQDMKASRNIVNMSLESARPPSADSRYRDAGYAQTLSPASTFVNSPETTGSFTDYDYYSDCSRSPRDDFRD